MRASPILATLINARSLRKQYLDVFNLLVDRPVDLLFITETWLDTTSDPIVTQATPRVIRSLERITQMEEGAEWLLFIKRSGTFVGAMSLHGGIVKHFTSASASRPILPWETL